MKNTELQSAEKHIQDQQSWRGYTLDELEHRRAVNAVKCDLIKEQLNLATSMAFASASGEGLQDVVGQRFNKAMSYLSYGVQFFKYARSLYSIIKSFRAG